MKYRLDPGPIEVVDDAVAEILRRKTPAERIAIASASQKCALEMMTARLQSAHPDWPEDKLKAEVTRRLTRGTG